MARKVNTKSVALLPVDGGAELNPAYGVWNSVAECTKFWNDYGMDVPEGATCAVKNAENTITKYVFETGEWRVDFNAPQGGIKKEDLANDVKASLNKADSALQEHQSLANYPTKSEVYGKGDVYSKTEADGKYQPKGNYLTEHQDISHLATKQALATTDEKVTQIGHEVGELATAVDEGVVASVESASQASASASSAQASAQTATSKLTAIQEQIAEMTTPEGEVIPENLVANVASNKAEIDGVKTFLEGVDEQEYVGFVQNYSGAISGGTPLPSTESTTSSNQLMKISLEGKGYKRVKATLAHSIDEVRKFGAIAFDRGTSSPYDIVLYKEPTTEGVYDYEVAIPSDAMNIWLFNRKTVLADVPDITFYKDAKGGFVEEYETFKNDVNLKMSDLEDAVENIDSKISGEIETTSIPYVQNYAGSLSSGAPFPTTPSTTGNNQLMRIVIPELRPERILARLGHGVSASENFYALSFENANGKPISGKSIPYIEYATEGIYDYDVEIPKEAVAIWIFNRKTVLDPVPDIQFITVGKKGFDERISDVENAIKSGVNSGYKTIVQKPLDFTGKSCLFFGDSITYGYMAGAGQSTYNYPKMFAQYVGATQSNKGVSGSTLSVIDTRSSIFNKIKETTLNSDFIFIAGGVNDHQMGVDAETLTSAMRDICEYLKANYNGVVIFITPINESGRVPIVTPTQTLQNVRNIITRIALEYEYNVVQGTEFPFPTESDTDEYKALMFQDNLHPTDLGYRMYAKALTSAVL